MRHAAAAVYAATMTCPRTEDMSNFSSARKSIRFIHALVNHPSN